MTSNVSTGRQNCMNFQNPGTKWLVLDWTITHDHNLVCRIIVAWTSSKRKPPSPVQVIHPAIKNKCVPLPWEKTPRIDPEKGGLGWNSITVFDVYMKEVEEGKLFLQGSALSQAAEASPPWLLPSSSDFPSIKASKEEDNPSQQTSFPFGLKYDPPLSPLCFWSFHFHCSLVVPSRIHSGGWNHLHPFSFHVTKTGNHGLIRLEL